MPHNGSSKVDSSINSTSSHPPSGIYCHKVKVCNWATTQKLLIISNNSGMKSILTSLKSFLLHTYFPVLYIRITARYSTVHNSQCYMNSKALFSILILPRKILYISVFI